MKRRYFVAVMVAMLALFAAPAPAQTPNGARAEELMQAWMEGAGLHWVQIAAVTSEMVGQVYSFYPEADDDGDKARRAAARARLLERTAALRRDIQAYPDPPDLSVVLADELTPTEARRMQQLLNSIRPRQLAVIDQIDAAAIADDEMRQQVERGEMSAAAAGRASTWMRLRPMTNTTNELVRGASVALPEGSPPELSIRASMLTQEVEDASTPLFVALLRRQPANTEAVQRQLADIAARARALAGEMRAAENYPLTYAANGEHRRTLARLHAYMPQAAALMEEFAAEVQNHAGSLSGLTASQVMERDAWEMPAAPDFLEQFTEPAPAPL